MFKKNGVDIQTFDDIIKSLCRYPDFDFEVCEYLESSGYLGHYNSDRSRNPHRYDVNLFIDNFKSVGVDCFIMLQSELTDIGYLAHRHVNNYKNFKKNHELLNLKYTRLYLDLYKNLLIEIKTRFEVISEVGALLGIGDVIESCKERAMLIEVALSK